MDNLDLDIKMTPAKKKSLNNKQIKKQRVMCYFIDAARELADTMPMESITIRAVADKAGYNSATLYNYFEDINQLHAFTAIDLMSEWLLDLARTVDSEMDPLEAYLYGWESFVKHSFSKPSGFEYAYVSSDADKTAAYFEDYCNTFPEVFGDVPKTLLEMFRQKTMEGQEKIMIAPVIEAGYILQKDAESIYQLAHILHTGLLNFALRPENRDRSEEYAKRFMKYFTSYIGTKLQKPADLSKYAG